MQAPKPTANPLRYRGYDRTNQWKVWRQQMAPALLLPSPASWKRRSFRTPRQNSARDGVARPRGRRARGSRGRSEKARGPRGALHAPRLWPSDRRIGRRRMDGRTGGNGRVCGRRGRGARVGRDGACGLPGGRRILRGSGAVTGTGTGTGRAAATARSAGGGGPAGTAVGGGENPAATHGIGWMEALVKGLNEKAK